MNNYSIIPPQNHTGSLSKREHYGALDGMRAYAAIGIVIMHVLANLQTKPSSNYFTQTVIPYFSNFVFLYMIISALGLSCGYYDRIRYCAIAPNAFYMRRIKRILPFFALMVLIDVLWEHNLPSLLEGFADLTLSFGLYPNANITVIGVGWFIGLVFVFYMLYPFFVFMLESKRRAWFTFAVSVALTSIGIYYFGSDKFFDNPMSFNRTNILYCAPFFIAGGLIYLYRHDLSQWVVHHSWVMLFISCAITVGAFASFSVVPSFFSALILFSCWIVYALGSRDVFFNNPVVRYLSKISMEIYLCHMLFFRLVSLAHFEKYISDGNLLYIATFIGTFTGAVLFSHVCKFLVIDRVKWLR